LVAHSHIVKVKAEKCSTITNLKKIYFQCNKHMHKVSCPRVATAYELFNKMLVHNNLYIIRLKTGATSTKLEHLIETITHIVILETIMLVLKKMVSL
jgi:hypothetical protein